MKKLPTSRRQFLQLAAGAGVASTGFNLMAKETATAGAAAPVIGDQRIHLEFDSEMRLRVSGAAQAALTGWSAAERLDLGPDSRLERFQLRSQSLEDMEGPLGKGTRLRLVGRLDAPQIEKTVVVELYRNFPGFAVYQVSYRYLGQEPVAISQWTQLALTVPNAGTASAGATRGAKDSAPPFWSFCGSTHSDRRDWVQPVRAGFKQDNFMGMEASDYGGGTPIVDVWRPDGGVAIGHIETTPRLVSLPLSCSATELNLSMTEKVKQTLKPGDVLVLPLAFVAAHRGDYFTVLDTYRRIMAVRGIASPQPPKAAYDAIWCAWGYERDCTLQMIVDTLPKVRELGLRWAVIDDGWQTNVGDWKVSTVRYPGGEADMRGLVKTIRSQGLEARLWWAPLAVAPGSDLLHDHTDMLLLDKDGAVQNVSWWNSFYLCPGYQPTVDYMTGLVRKFIGDWGYAGLKIDGQHLNSVAPCYNPAHKHARPEESVEKLQDFFQAVYAAALQSNPQAVVELCPCGTSYSFFNFRSFNQAPASDPESSWQVRHKGKSLKALMGPSAAFAGDHVELSTGGADFASTVGIGGIVSTKFTWPRDPKPKDSFLLTPAHEPIWRKWIALYNEKQLPLGTYRGELYDIGFDRPETHVIEKAGRFYYAFYGRDFSGSVPLRGLKGGRYRVRDYYNERNLGEVTARNNRLQVAFNDFLVIEAVPA
ncbi:MAG: alpha-galactosidase [Proteobacteria bacterium]|nr:alpha-galactosidase [Pseudomonadota bacterium]